MTLQPKIQGHTIVLIGNFNPKIFQPIWFSAEGLLQKQEAEKANIEIIHSDVVIFSLDWLRIAITHDRFSAETTQESHYEVVRDLIIGTFELLRHTPITKLGINTDMHFLMESEEKWHEVGHKLAPKDYWNEILEEPGMISLIMEGKRRDGFKGYIRVTTQPSIKIHPGVYFGVNDHFETSNPDTTVGSDEIMNMLKSSWRDSYEKSKGTIYSLLERLT